MRSESKTMKIDLSRRSFLVGASALSFTGCALPKGAAERPNLSFGVLSDIHITHGDLR